MTSLHPSAPATPRERRSIRPVEAKLEGTALVEASAGTGKTFTITTLFLRLIVEAGLSVQQIVVVTFTEAATAELRARIRRRLREALAAFDDPTRASDPDLRAIVERTPDREEGRRRVAEAMSALDQAAISTIHAFCLRALQERAFESGARFGLELMADTSELAREIAEDYWSSRMVPMAPDLYRIACGKLSLETTRALVEVFARRPPDVAIVPAPPSTDPEALRPELAKAYAAARRTWHTRGEGETVRALLLSSDGLSQNQNTGYTEDNVTRWCRELDALFASEAPTYACTSALEALSAATIAERTKRKKTPPSHAFFRQAQALFELSKRVETDLVLTLKRDLADYVRREMASRKAALGAQGFEDLLFALDRALAGAGGDDLARALRGQYKAALIDEFQDTDPVQFRIFRRVFHDGRTPLLFVGDPKQSIYAFRGADVFSYFQAAKDAREAPYTLDTNHRSDPSLVRAVNAIFARTDEAFVFDEIQFRPVQARASTDRITFPDPKAAGAFEILFLPRKPGQDKPFNKGDLRDALPELVAAEIERFLASGACIAGAPVRAGDVAVLTRSNKQAEQVQEALRKLGIPTALESEASVFESDEAGELEQVLRAVLEPTRMPVLRSALATSIAGLSAERIVALEADERGWQEWSERFRSIQDVWATRGFMPAYRRLLRELGTEPRLLSYVDGERRVTNLLHLGDLLHAASRRERLGLSGIVRWLGAMRATPHAKGHLEGEAAELRLESDARAVKLLTIHKSKGLEYPVVYCPFLWDASVRTEETCLAFHDPNDEHRLKLHVAPKDAHPDITAAAERESRAEMQRLLYVALTRAKHRCSIVWGAIRDADASCLGYTLHPQRPTLKGVSDEDLRADLGELEKSSEGAIVVRDLGAIAAGPELESVAEDPPSGEANELRARSYERKVDRWWRIGSFSAMTSGAHGVGGGALGVAAAVSAAVAAAAADEVASGPAAEGRDRDEVDEPSLAVDADADAAVEVGDAGAGPAEEARVVLHAFPRGAKPGTLLHAILEEHDFTSREPEALPALVREKLAAFGYEGRGLEDTLVAGIDAMLDTPLGIGAGAGACLRDIPRARRVDELEFVLPVTHTHPHTHTDGQRLQVTAKAIAEVLAKHRTDAVPAAYAEQVARLGFVPLRGFLRGFVDLVFEHEGRFYVVDYKSNHLGPTASAYAPARLTLAMSHASYFLQYHLYTVAVHRWLARRMRGYDYDRAFGGVLYLFARGMHPSHPVGTGIFADRPKRELVEALSEVLDHG